MKRKAIWRIKQLVFVSTLVVLDRVYVCTGARVKKYASVLGWETVASREQETSCLVKLVDSLVNKAYGYR
jgi:hypothetical protein